ncbi:MAG TPA: hypothetical protein V6D22_09595 [Candidatus Obscuribacterales bacterium]
MKQEDSNELHKPRSDSSGAEGDLFSLLVKVAGFEEQAARQDCDRAFLLNQGRDNMIGIYLNHADSDCKYFIMFGLPADETAATNSAFEMCAFIIQYLATHGEAHSN